MPMTSLAAQLKRLETPQTSLLSHKKKKASFLFDAKEAARIDRDTFYEIGLSGLEELKRLNPDFAKFEGTLFDVASKSFERAVESSEANEKLDYRIKTFLTLVSPFFLIKSSHKAIEWLINRFHIHEFNVDDLMFLILPYHETMQFARMLQIIPIKENTGTWHWLYNVKKEGVPLSKTALLNRAAKDMSFLKFVANMPTDAIKIHGEKASSLATLYGFYCTTVIGGLEYTETITELHISHLLPSLMSGLGSPVPDFTASAFMIIARLSTKACLGEKILNGLFNKISKVEHKKLSTEATLVMVLLCQNAIKKITLPEKALKNLSESEWFVPSLAVLSKQKVLISPFVLSIIRSAISSIVRGDQNLKEFVQNLINVLQLDDSDAQQIFDCLLEEFDEDSDEVTLCWYSRLLRELEKSFPNVFDATMTKAFSVRNSKEAVAFKTILGVNASRNELYEKLVHVNEEVRVAALKHILKHIKPQELSWLKQPLLERFKDDSPLVVKMILNLPFEIMSTFPPEELFENLITIITKFETESDIMAKVVPWFLSKVTRQNVAVLSIVMIPHLYDLEAEGIDDKVDLPPYCKLLQFIFNSETKNYRQQFIKALKKSELFPSTSEIFSAFEKYSIFKKTTRYWFSTALLVSGSLPTLPDQKTVESVMDFFLQYLKHSEISVMHTSDSLDSESLKKCLNLCKNSLPIEGALQALFVLMEKTLDVQKESELLWFDFSSKEKSFTLFVYKVIHEGIQSTRKSVRKAFQKTLSVFLKNHFVNVQTQMNFFLNALIYDPSLGAYCLSHVEKILNNDKPNLSPLLQEESIFVPALLILLGFKEEAVRLGVFKIIDILADSLVNEFYRPLLDELVAFSDEIKIDHEQISILAYSRLSPAKEIQSLHSHSKQKSMAKILEKFVSIIKPGLAPIYIQAGLLRVLEFVQSEEMLLSFIPQAEAIVCKRQLEENEGFVLLQILKRFNLETVRCLKNEELWKFLRRFLAEQESQIECDGKKLCPAAILLNQISKEVFDGIPEPKLETQEKLLSLIIASVADSENPQVVSASMSLFKRITIDSKILVSLLNPMLKVEVPPKAGQISLRPRQRRSTAAPPLEILQTDEWKRGIFLIEMTQNKKKLTSIHLLLPVLFNILKRCLQFEEQGPVEYNKQLLLSSILHCCERITDMNAVILTPETLHVDLVVDCLRASQNPQTHHHALLTLTYVAQLVPEQVLHNLMAVFTFIGSSVLRQDDAYSFQIITKVIDTVIPVLIESTKDQDLHVSVANVIRVFVAALLDVPEHRRIPLMHKLMVTMEDGKYLWIFLLLVFESQVMRPTPVAAGPEENAAIPKRLDIALQLCAEFPPLVILQTCHKVLAHACALPHDKDEKNVQKIKDKLILSIFNVEENSGKQLRHYKYTMVMFLSYLLSSSNFVLQVAELSDEEMESLNEIFELFLEENLIYLKSVLKQVELSSGLPTAKYWKVVLNQTYDILDKTNALLPTETFLKVVGNLMKNELEAVRRKSMELLGWRLQQPRPLPTETLVELVKPLEKCLETISPQETSQEAQLTQQTALFAMKLMARHLAQIYKDIFKTVLEKLSSIICAEFPPNLANIQGSLVLCIGELTSTLKAHSLSQLPVFMPAIIKILKQCRNKDGNEMLLLSVVTSVHKVVDCLVLFLSPFIDSILYEISLLSSKYFGEQQEASKSHLVQKLKMIRQKLSSETPNRVLVPSISTCFSKLVKNGHFVGVSPLMSVLTESITSSSDLTVEITNFFLSALQFRADFPHLTIDEIDSVETPVIASLTFLILKLSEAAFRPLFNKLYDWALRFNEQKERTITFYRLTHKIAVSLKSLFALFAGIFIPNCSESLDEIINSKNSEGNYVAFEGDFSVEKTRLLLDSILSTLLAIFTYDSQNFITKERFGFLLMPLVNLLENEVGGLEYWEERCEKLLTPCIAELSTSTSDDSLWKQLNYQVLLKTRHEKSHVRLAAVKTVCSLAGKLGEDFLPLLPETVPFLAELLEDDDEKVEKECQKVVNDLEVILGEPIQKYF